LKRAIAIILFVAVLVQAFSQVVIVASFFANQDFIAKNLCENRDKPQMHCNGKCCLKKKMEKNAQNESSQSGKKYQQVLNIFCSTNKIEAPSIQIMLTRAKYFNHDETMISSFHHSVFHPPAA